jgi:RecB family endonuclease NucS
MRIMVRGKGETGWKPLDASDYDSEAHLQELLNKDIGLIPLEPPLTACAREFGLPGSGATDIVAVDSEGAVTIIECKLAQSREVRRMVIGQLLEYAAFLTKMPVDEFVERFDGIAEKPLYQAMADKLGDEGEDFEEPTHSGG